MATAVFLNLPAHGHINPTLPLVAELVRRGEKIIYYASDQFRTKIEAAGATYRSYDYTDSFDPSKDMGGPLGLMARSIEWAELMLPTLSPQVQADQPDYLMIDSMCIWANLLQQKLKLPTITTFSTFAFNFKVMGQLRRSRAPQPPMKEFIAGIPRLFEYFRTGRRLNRRYGVRTPGLSGFFANQQDLNLVFTSREFQPCAESFDASFRFVGPSIAPRSEPDDFPLHELDDQPVIYISLGTIFNNAAPFYRDCFTAFGNSPYRVVMSIGRTVQMDALGTPPANFIVRPYVPQLEILQRAALFITHGGMNSVSESLFYGVPVVVVPQTGDQYFVAQQVSNIGAGVGLTMAQATPQRLRELAEQVLNDASFRQKAEHIGVSLREAGGYHHAADEVLAWVAKQ